MLDKIQQKLIDCGLSEDDLPHFEGIANLITFTDFSKENLGNLTYLQPIGRLKEQVAYLFQCGCGKRCIKTLERLRAAKLPNCGCKDNNEDAMKYWKKYKKRLGGHWANNFRLFREECFALKEDNVYLNRKFTDRKIGPHNFYWANFTERYCETHNKIIDILVVDQGLTKEGAKERVLSMSSKQRVKFLKEHQARQAKEYDVKFLEKFGKNPPPKAKETKWIRLPTPALMKLSMMLIANKYDELNIKFLYNNDQLQCQLARLAQPLTWNPTIEDWDL